MRRHTQQGTIPALLASVSLLAASAAWAQTTPAGGDTREGVIVAQEQQKATQLKPYEPNKAEE